MSSYKKTRLMNILGALGMVTLGIALFFNKLDEQPIGVLAAIVVMYATLTFVPVGTALALSAKGGAKLRTVMLWANWALIAVWCLGVAATVYIRQPLGMSLLSALLFVLPEWLNIRALRSLSMYIACEPAGEAQPIIPPVAAR